MGPEELLPQRTTLDGLETLELAEERGFYLYRESAMLVGVAAHVYFGHESDFPLNRDQAITNGLAARIAKFMLVVTKLASETQYGEVISALNRCILESAINLEYLAKGNTKEGFDEYVERSLGPERELHDEILKNISDRGGEHLPIEDRMLRSIDNVTRALGKPIAEVKKQSGQWGGGNFRARLAALGKEDLYLTIQRISSHAIHGTWVDLYLNHLLEDENKGCYRIRQKKRCDARILTPSAFLVLLSVHAYVDSSFENKSEVKFLLDAIAELCERLKQFEGIHEKLFSA